MGNAVGEALAYAVGISISPIPIIGVVLMLATPRGRVNGPAFLLGWFLGIFATGSVVIFLFGSSLSSDSGETSTTSAWVFIALGILLLAVARRQFVSRPRPGDEPKLPSWMGAVDHFDPLRAFAMGIALTVLNPKNLLLILGAAAAIAENAASDSAELGALVIFSAIAMIGPTVPVAVYFTKRDKADEILGRMKVWLAANNNVVMAVLCLLIAAKLLGDGITSLSN
jgi:threonine/homoserine/homoserine lactone efflux protein